MAEAAAKNPESRDMFAVESATFHVEEVFIFTSWFSSHNFSLIRTPWSSLRPREIESKAQNRFTPPKRTDGRANGHSLARSPARHHTCSFEPPIWAGCVPAPGPAHALASDRSSLIFMPHGNMSGERRRRCDLIGFELRFASDVTKDDPYGNSA